MYYICPKCGYIMIPETIMTIPSSTIYKCFNCGYTSKPLTDPIKYRTLPPQLRNDDQIKVVETPTIRKVNSITINVDCDDNKNYDIALLDVVDFDRNMCFYTEYPKCDMSFGFNNVEVYKKEGKDG